MTLPAGLYVVATPLGNADDLSPRARQVLAGAGLILAEDTRRAGLLFQRLSIERSGEFLSFYEQNEDKRLPRVLKALEEGAAVALMSDAGTPLISDPGYTLVRACREAGHKVTPVPGPCAPVAALCASGLPPLPFTFLGFAPRKPGQLRTFFQAHGATGATLVFFERKSRVRATLEAAFEVLGPRPFCLARELTKPHEEFLPGDLSDLSALDEEPRGELTVVIGPARDVRTDEAALDALIEEESREGGRPKDQARRVAARASGWTAKQVYERMAR